MDEEDTVGRGRPPKHARFKKGQSGNPSGRPKGSTNYTSRWKKQLSKTVVVRRGEKLEHVRSDELIIERTIDNAIRGNPKATDMTMKMAERLDEEAATRTVEATSAEDEMLIREFARRLLDQQRSRED
jgi:hypothetical protein